MDQELIELTKAALRSQDNPQAGQFWIERLSPILGGDSWLGEGDPVLLDSLASWAIPEDEAQLSEAVQRAASDQGAALIDWLDSLFNRTSATDSAGEPGLSDPSVPDSWSPDAASDAEIADEFFVGITDVGAGWWAGQDRQTGEYWYVQSESRPDGNTPGWTRQSSEEPAEPAQPDSDDQVVPAPGVAAVTADPDDQPTAAERYTNLSPVDGYQDWWVGWDTITSAWCYVNTPETPDANTPGWLTQDEAFAQMASSTPEPASSAAFEQPPADAAADPAVQEPVQTEPEASYEIPAEIKQILEAPDAELATVLEEFNDPATLFDGFDLTGYTPEQIRAALIEASQIDPASAEPQETVEL